MLEQHGSTVVAVNGASVATITYPNAFPTATETVLVTSGDANLPGGAAEPVLNVVGASVTASGFQVQCLRSTTAAGVTPGTNMRLNWIAFGH